MRKTKPGRQQKNGAPGKRRSGHGLALDLLAKYELIYQRFERYRARMVAYQFPVPKLLEHVDRMLGEMRAVMFDLKQVPADFVPPEGAARGASIGEGASVRIASGVVPRFGGFVREDDVFRVASVVGRMLVLENGGKLVPVRRSQVRLVQP